MPCYPNADAVETKESERLSALIRRHHGNISEIARRLNFTRQAITRHLDRYGLLEEAQRARTSAFVPGPRVSAPLAVDVERERRELLAALGRGGHKGAARELGVGPSTILRRMRKLGLTAADYLE